MIAQALQMGDEGHNRNRAGTSLLLRELLPALIELDEPSADVAAVARFIAGNDHFFLNLTMPASKAMRRRRGGRRRARRSSTTMARNGTEFGIRLSGTGDRWFTGPSGMIDGLYLPGYRAPRTPTPTSATARSPRPSASAASRWRPRRRSCASSAAAPRTRSRPRAAMYEITLGREPSATRSRRSASAARRSGSTAARSSTRGVLPFVNTGIAHREPGVGQIGAGLVKPPMEAFVEAVRGAGRAVIAAPVAAPVLDGRRLAASSHVSRTRRYLELDGFVVAVVGPGVPLMPNGVVLTGPPETGRVVLEGATIWDPTLRLRGDESLEAPGDAPLAHALRDPVLAAEIARGLIGRGPGLTPEGDDAVAVTLRSSRPMAAMPQRCSRRPPRRTTALSATLLEIAAQG